MLDDDGSHTRAKATTALGRPRRRQPSAAFAARSIDAVEAADRVIDGGQNLMDVSLAVLEPGEASFSDILRGQPDLAPASGPAVGGRPRLVVSALLDGTFGACQLSGLLVVATDEWFGHRRW